MGAPEIRDYLARHASRYTREALRAQLIEAGYSSDEVDEAEAAMAAGTRAGRPTLRFLVVPYVVALVTLTVVLFLFAFEFQYIGTFGPAILAIVLLVLGLVLIRVLRANRAVQMGIAGGLATALLVPLVTVVAVAGLCVATTNPRVALPHQRAAFADLAPSDAWDPAAGMALSAQGRVGALFAVDDTEILVPPGQALVVQFSDLLPPDAEIDSVIMTIEFDADPPLEFDIQAEPPRLLVRLGTGDLARPVMTRTPEAHIFAPALQPEGGPVLSGEALQVQVAIDAVATAADLAALRVSIAAPDAVTSLHIDRVVMSVQYHRR